MSRAFGSCVAAELSQFLMAISTKSHSTKAKNSANSLCILQAYKNGSFTQAIAKPFFYKPSHSTRKTGTGARLAHFSSVLFHHFKMSMNAFKSASFILTRELIASFNRGFCLVCDFEVFLRIVFRALSFL